ncbi:diguanylate cyclase [Psychromonas sp. MME1]|uniref:GGDEF domain-containing response regulator n=1 Tax=Psychromonas sp. MME1 TaxID=3231032 RepID=UPI0034E1D25B
MILDISGEIQGVELVEDIREQFPSTTLGILGVTPHGYNSQLSIEFLKKGANDFITKPFVKEQLTLRIMQVLEMLDTIKEKSIEATIDPLTQLKNRRALESESKKLIQSALISNSYLSVAMIDIDHFKLINDTYGHDIGDDILKLISQVLKSSLRKKDLIVRNGGEEFCIVLSDLTLKKAIDVFEILRKKIASTSYKKDGVKINVTVSIGLFHGIKKDLKSMMRLADEKLYIAKDNGRNKLVS